MDSLLISEEQDEEIQKILTILAKLPQEDMAVLLSNACVLKARHELEKAKNS